MEISLGHWEHGSEFHLCTEKGDTGPNLPQNSELYGSGRDALRSILRHGQQKIGWTTIWVPSYFCQKVIRDIQTEGLKILAYGDSPMDNESDWISLAASEPSAVLTLNPFGLRTRARPLGIDRRLMSVIEDHTHDPWSPLARASTADFCIASLRKTIPIPDGGVLWSPRNLPLPICPAPTRERATASIKKLAGMAMKSLYLDGATEDKSLARVLMTEGENDIASGEVSGMPYSTQALLSGFNAAEWRRRRQDNFWRAASLIPSDSKLKVLTPKSPKSVPFSIVLLLSTRMMRDGLRERLIESDVYPAVLWSLEDLAVEGVRIEDVDFSQRLLTLHCDGRYTEKHMIQVAQIVNSRLGT